MQIQISKADLDLVIMALDELESSYKDDDERSRKTVITIRRLGSSLIRQKINGRRKPRLIKK